MLLIKLMCNIETIITKLNKIFDLMWDRYISIYFYYHCTKYKRKQGIIIVAGIYLKK